MLTLVILLGAASMRLWPVSREGRPKPAMELHHHRSEHWIAVSGIAGGQWRAGHLRQHQ